MFAERRRKRVRRTRLILAGASALTLTLLVAVLPLLNSHFGLKVLVGTDRVNKFLLSLLPGKAGDVVGDALTGVLSTRLHSMITFAICAVAAWLAWKKSAETIYDRAFAEFNDEVLARIAAPRPFDPLRGAAGIESSDVVLEWNISDAGPRREVWEEVMRFVFAELDQSRVGYWAEAKPTTPFGWTLLMGRAGSGKSRLAVEAARHVARRAHFGTNGQATRLDRIAVWWRTQVRSKMSPPKDPWEAGWLLPGVGLVAGTAYPAWVGRQAVSTDNPWLTALREWRPRRPTLLLLDDPRPGDSKAIIGALRASAKNFTRPVRLLIVNQSAPAELGLAKRGGIWRTSGGLEPLIPPILLPDGSRMTEADIRRLRGSLDRSGRYPLGLDTQVKAFLEVTRGNPLLVELGLKWLREGRPLATMSEDRLLTDRVDRVLEALQQAGLTETIHHRAIAVATLAGGAIDMPERSGMGKLLATYPLPFDESADLFRVFPADMTDLRNALPPIRPEAIGDAFIRRIIGESSSAEQRRMIATSWTVDPSGTLRSALRLARVPDELGTLLRAGPPDNAGLDPAEVALAYAEAASWLPPETRTESLEVEDARRLAPLAETLCNRLGADAATRLMEPMLELAEAREQARPFLGGTWLRLVGATMARMSELPPDQSLDLAERLFALSMKRKGRLYDKTIPKTFDQGWTKLIYPPYRGHEGFERLATIYQQFTVHPLATSVSTRCAAVLLEATTLGSSDARTVAAVAFLARSGDSSVCQRLASAVDRIAAQFPDDQNLQYQRAYAWGSVAFAIRADPNQGHAHAEKVDQIVAPFPRDHNLQYVRARVWRVLAFMTAGDASQCRAHAETVNRIAASFPADRDFQYERAQAWRNVTFATQTDANECRAHAETVDRIAASFPDDRDFQHERAQAWRSVAYATQTDANQCRAHAETVDRIAASFLDYRDLQYERAMAWRVVAYAAQADANQCRVHAETVDRIAAPFPDDRDFQHERALAWRVVALATQADASQCRASAEVVDRIAAPFPDDRDFQHERAQAWRGVAYATIADAPRCHASAETVDRIAAPFPGDRDVQYERAHAWCSAVYSTLADPVRSLAYAEKVDFIAAPFPEDRDLKFERAATWRCIAHATTFNASQCRMHAEKVDLLAAPFPNDRDFQHERAHAWRSVAFATRADASQCRAAAEMIDGVVAPFPDDPQLQNLRRQAWTLAKGGIEEREPRLPAHRSR